MDQIFGNIDWDNVLTVITDYVTKMDVATSWGKFAAFIKDFFDVVAGELIKGIFG